MEEVFDLGERRLGVRQVGRHHVTQAIGQLELAETFRLMHNHAAIVDFYLLARLRVVINNHALGTHDARSPHLLRRQPAHFAGGDASAGELKPQVGHIALGELDAGAAERGRLARELVQPVKQNRYVVNGQIPHHVDVLAVEPEIDS